MRRINFRRINYRHYICIAFVLLSLAYGVFKCLSSYIRLGESVLDFGTSIAFYFCKVCGIESSLNASVNNLSHILDSSSAFIPITYDLFSIKAVAYFKSLFNLDTLKLYGYFLVGVLFILFRVLLIALPIILVLHILVKQYTKTFNNDYNKDSKPLRAYKKVSKYFFGPIFSFIRSLFVFVKEHKFYKYSLLFIWSLNFNIITIGVEFVAYLIYFAVSFNFASLYTQFLKLSTDLTLTFAYMPLWLTILLVIILIHKLRLKVAYGRLRHFENRNKGFINSQPLSVFLTGSMGTKKTTTATDFCLSIETIFRDKALELMLDNVSMFPNFPFINLENYIKKMVDLHVIYNLASCRKQIRDRKHYFYKCIENSFYFPKKLNNADIMIFGYNYLENEIYFDNNLEMLNLWQVIEEYSQLYFIYIIQSSLIVSNLSIRSDNIMQDFGNFPLWDTDFFSRKSAEQDIYSRYANILDFDMLRLGKKVLADNEKANALEFGIFDITEIAKERGNSPTLTDIKKSDINANQKNDLFNYAIKMCRHKATVGHFPFVRFICDDQRADSLGADMRELCELIRIKENKDKRLALPLFFLEELLHDIVFSRFSSFFLDYRFIRADNTLFMHLLKNISFRLHNYYVKTYNLFGYTKLVIETESGKQDGEVKEYYYYLSDKKIYSKRFSSDCYADFFAKNILSSKFGLEDLEEYKSVCASKEELAKQNSYFIRDLEENTK